MTCIVGLVDNGRVFIGGDSAGVSDLDVVVRADEKVFVNGPFLMGFTTSFRMGQLLRYALRPPKWIDGELYRFMVVDFIDDVRRVLADGGMSKKEDNVEEGGQFLVGAYGHLFTIGEDFQVGENIHGYAACGCGEAYAMASFFSTARLTPRRRVQTALEAAEEFSGGVRRPFKILSSRATP